MVTIRRLSWWVTLAVVVVATRGLGASGFDRLQQAPPGQKPQMTFLPENADGRLEQLSKERQTTLANKIKQDQQYVSCLKAPSKEAAKNCLGTWERAAMAYWNVEIAFWKEVEGRDTEALEVYKTQLASLESRRERLKEHPAAAAVVKEEAAAYTAALDHLRKQIAALSKGEGSDAAKIINLESQARYFEQALNNVASMSTGLEAADQRMASAISRYRDLSQFHESILSQSKTAGLNARVGFQATVTMKLDRDAWIQITFPEPIAETAREAERITNDFAPFDRLTDCLAQSPTKTADQCRGQYRMSPPPSYATLADCRRVNQKLSESQCASLVRKKED